MGLQSRFDQDLVNGRSRQRQIAGQRPVGPPAMGLGLLTDAGLDPLPHIRAVLGRTARAWRIPQDG